MKKQRINNQRINNLYEYLRKTDADEIIIQTSFVSGCWYDNEFDAHAAGFKIIRYNDDLLREMHKFSECYLITRR